MLSRLASPYQCNFVKSAVFSRYRSARFLLTRAEKRRARTGFFVTSRVRLDRRQVPYYC